MEAIIRMRPYLAAQPYRTCDYTPAGIFMWRSFFNFAVAALRTSALLCVSGGDRICAGCIVGAEGIRAASAGGGWHAAAV